MCRSASPPTDDLQAPGDSQSSPPAELGQKIGELIAVKGQQTTSLLRSVPGRGRGHKQPVWMFLWHLWIHDDRPGRLQCATPTSWWFFHAATPPLPHANLDRQVSLKCPSYSNELLGKQDETLGIQVPSFRYGVWGGCGGSSRAVPEVRYDWIPRERSGTVNLFRCVLDHQVRVRVRSNSSEFVGFETH